MSSSPRRVVEYSRAALIHNLEMVRDSFGIDEILDIRCDAYGHGATWVSTIAESLGFHRLRSTDSESLINAASRLMYGVTNGVPVATVFGEVVALKTIPALDSVSYGYTWTASRESKLALIALGFADGIPRRASNRGRVLLNGTSLPAVGRIAMDQLVVDITDGHANIGDRAQLWAAEAPISEWTANGHLDPLVVLHNLGWRVDRDWVQ